MFFEICPLAKIVAIPRGLAKMPFPTKVDAQDETDAARE